MEYITHKRYNKKALCQRDMNIPRGTRFKTIAHFIATDDGKAICTTTSDDATRYFARDDDGHGLRRGAITYTISKGPKLHTDGSPFSEDDFKKLIELCDKYIMKNQAAILFNHDFYKADIDELEDIVKTLDLKVIEDY